MQEIMTRLQKRVTIQRILTPKASAVNKSNGIQLSWNTVTSATKYNVYRRIGGTSNWVYVGTTTGNTLLDKGVVKGKSYAYSIRAINGIGYSAYDSSKCAAIKH
jgi:fibronectin type 3 domain-containing protein